MSFGSKAAERIAGKTILITGASSGIGAAIVSELASAANGKLRLILAARRLSRLEDLKKQLLAKYSDLEVLPLELDVSDYISIPSKIASLPREWSSIDVLINNAGLARGLDHVGDLKVADVEAMYFTNVIGMVTLTNTVIPQMKQRNKGDIVMIGSTAGWESYPGGSVYASTKACLKSFTEALRKENISNRLRIIEVDPGLVETEFSLVRFEGDSSKASGVYNGFEPLVGGDIAEVVVFNLTRRVNTVVANSLVLPSNQASSSSVFKK